MSFKIYIIILEKTRKKNFLGSPALLTTPTNQQIGYLNRPCIQQKAVKHIKM